MRQRDTKTRREDVEREKLNLSLSAPCLRVSVAPPAAPQINPAQCPKMSQSVPLLKIHSDGTRSRAPRRDIRSRRRKTNPTTRVSSSNSTISPRPAQNKATKSTCDLSTHPALHGAPSPRAGAKRTHSREDVQYRFTLGNQHRPIAKPADFRRRIDAQEVEEGGGEIVVADGVFGGVGAVFVG